MEKDQPEGKAYMEEMMSTMDDAYDASHPPADKITKEKFLEAMQRLGDTDWVPRPIIISRARFNELTKLGIIAMPLSIQCDRCGVIEDNEEQTECRGCGDEIRRG